MIPTTRLREARRALWSNRLRLWAVSGGGLAFLGLGLLLVFLLLRRWRWFAGLAMTAWFYLGLHVLQLTIGDLLEDLSREVEILKGQRRSWRGTLRLIDELLQTSSNP